MEEEINSVQQQWRMKRGTTEMWRMNAGQGIHGGHRDGFSEDTRGSLWMCGADSCFGWLIIDGSQVNRLGVVTRVVELRQRTKARAVVCENKSSGQEVHPVVTDIFIILIW